MFDSMLTAFQAFFSRAFWFGCFLPVALGAVLHAVILSLAIPGVLPVDRIGKPTETTMFFALTVGALVVLAYAIAPLTPALRAILDGWFLPDWLHDLLRAPRVRRCREMRQRAEQARTVHNAFNQIRNQEWPRKVWAAGEVGEGLCKADAIKKIEKAEAAICQLSAEMKRVLPEPAQFQSALDMLCEALKVNSAKLSADHHDFANSERLALARSRLRTMIDQALDEAYYALARAEFKRSRSGILPTRVGDAREAVERYSLDAYRVDFDFVWPRIQMLLQKPVEGANDYYERLNDAQSQISFAVLSLALTATVPIIWLPVLALMSTKLWLFLLIGALSPIVIMLLYELVVQSQRAFGDVVKVAIDKYRQQVLTDILRQPAPRTLAAERHLWRQLKAATDPGNEFDLVFAPSAPVIATPAGETTG